MKAIRYGFWAVVAVCLIVAGLANRELTTLRVIPEPLAGYIGFSPQVTLPLFVVIFLCVGLGLFIGLLWEWVREHRIRAEGRATSRELATMRREVEQLRAEAAGSKSEDDVLALLEKAS